MLHNINDFAWLKNYFNIANSIRDNEKLCVVPWMHLNFEPNGKVVPCCLTSHYNYFAGDLTTESISEIWNSDNMKSLRLKMINGEEPNICTKCFQREKVSGESGRIFHNKEFKKVIDIIPAITEVSGHATKMELKYWDFRFSNLCNFKCRSCGPRYSSSWVPDAKKLGWIIEQDKVTNFNSIDSITNFKFLEEQIHVVEKIYFAGGEPLMMDEHWYILELLEKHNKFNVRICYNTNLSTLIYKKKNVLDFWKKWNPYKVEIWPSIDEIGDRAELIRSGTVWNKIHENLISLTNLKSAYIKPGITVGAMNVFRLPEILTYLTDMGIISRKWGYKNFYFNLLDWPEYYHVKVLPFDYRQDIIVKLNNFIIDYNTKYDTDISQNFVQILSELEKPFDMFNAIKFCDMTDRLDEMRNENTRETIPEIISIYDSVLK
jgi:radical SAM protein with 4Fe4S-binding SPASM domain